MHQSLHEKYPNTEFVLVRILPNPDVIRRFTTREYGPVANWLIGKVVGIKRFNDRLMKVNTVIGDLVWEVVSCYCPQASRSVNEKEEFYDLMDKVVTGEVLVGGNFKGAL